MRYNLQPDTPSAGNCPFAIASFYLGAPLDGILVEPTSFTHLHSHLSDNCVEFSLLFFKPALSWLVNFAQGRLGVDRDHDVAVFKRLDALAGENHISDILNSRIYNKRIRTEDDPTLSDLIEALHLIENFFLDSTLQKNAKDLRGQLEGLLNVVRRTFFSVPGEGLKFYPDLIASDRYDEERKELNRKIDSAWEAYKTFRMSVKRRLKV